MAEDEDESLKMQLQELQAMADAAQAADAAEAADAADAADAAAAAPGQEVPESQPEPQESQPAVEAAEKVAETTEAAEAAEATQPQAPNEVAEAEPAAAPEAAEHGEVEPGEPENGESVDIVPQVIYDEKSNFTKEGRWVLPKRNQFPSVFCPLRVRVRLASPLDVSVVNPYKIPVEEVEEIFRESLGFKDLFIRFDDCRDRIDAAVNAREVIVAINGDLPEGLRIGDIKELEKYEKQSLSATIVDVLETSNDLDPERLSALKSRLKEAETCDALVLELPQIWIISDPEFRAKSASIGLYPGSFWMGFLKSWGAVKVAEVFFKRSPGDTGREAMVSVAVQFREQENLRMCFTFLHDRYLVHPKQKNALRQPWGRLVVFEDFKAKTLGRPAQKPKAAAKAQLQINRPLAAKPAAAKAAPAAKAADSDHQLTPAEAMAGLSGRTLEAFQMVMNRMERLERENKELMQVLIQMQALLQQSQQRNEQLAGIARADPATNSTARLALEAQRHAMMAGAMPPPPVPPVPEPKRSAEHPETEETAERPWKHQRRRQRRSAEVDDGLADVTANDDPEAAGLTAYHNALLGV